MIKRVNHMAIVVEDIEKAIIPYRDGLGLIPTEIEINEAFNVKIAFFPVGDTQIELVQPLGTAGELVDYLHKNGSNGLHHLALEVDDIEHAIKNMEKAGLKMKDKTPKSGANNSKVAFAETESFDGVIIELVQI